MTDKDDLILYDDAINFLCGKQIGHGSSRLVFESDLFPGYVIKVEKDRTSFQNLREFDVWSSVMHTEHSKWFAEVKCMSPNGRILLMERTTRPGLNEWPEKLPIYLADLKRENFGMSMLTDPKTGKASNRFVAHDYGLHLLLENGMTKRMRKVDWDKNEN